MKKNLFMLLVFLLLFTVIAVGCGSNGDDGEERPKGSPVYLNMATGNTAGTYYPVGGVLCELWNKNIETMNATAQSTVGSVGNVNLLREGGVDIAIIQGDAAYFGLQGESDITEYPGIRGITTLHEEPYHIATVDPALKSIADLKGKKVTVGDRGSIIGANCRMIFAAEGMDMDKDVKAQYLPHSESFNNLKDGLVDACIANFGVPASAVLDASFQRQLYLMPIKGEFREKLIEEMPFYAPTVIPGGTYTNIDDDCETITVKAIIAVDESMDADTVYALLDTMYANLDTLAAGHSAMESLSLEKALEGMPIPLHEGAEQFFKDKGLV